LGGAAVFQMFTRTTGLLRPVAKRDHMWLALLSVLGVALNQTLYLIGLRSTSPTSASLLNVSIPVFTATLAALLRQAKLSVRTVLGLALACGGVTYLTGVRSVDRGALIIALNCLCYSAYIVLSRRIILRLGAFTAVTWIFTWASVLFVPVGATAFARGAP